MASSRKQTNKKELKKQLKHPKKSVNTQRKKTQQGETDYPYVVYRAAINGSMSISK